MSKALRRNLTFIAIYGVFAYFFPIFAAFLLLLGFLDMARNKRFDLEFIRTYFLGKGNSTWLFSPVNFLVDLFSWKNKYVYELEDLPELYQKEITEVIDAIKDRKEEIMARLEKDIEGKDKGILFFKWYGKDQDTSIPELNKKFKSVSTIGVSVFNKHKSTNYHFGTVRAVTRVLYNLNPVQSDDIYIDVRGERHYWHDNPLFIFDDTLYHRSVNDSEHLRYCAFIDILRPTYFRFVPGFVVTLIRKGFRDVKNIFGFFRNWELL